MTDAFSVASFLMAIFSLSSADVAPVSPTARTMKEARSKVKIKHLWHLITPHPQNGENEREREADRQTETERNKKLSQQHTQLSIWVIFS